MKTANSYKPWTSRELDLILKLVKSGEKTLKEAANKFGRSLAAVEVRMNRVGISLATLKPIVSNRVIKEREAIQRVDLYRYSLNEGSRYKVDLKIMQRAEPTQYLTCVKNYREYIRFKNDAGINICHMKVDLINNPTKVKEIK